jgi:hypothetical protein
MRSYFYKIFSDTSEEGVDEPKHTLRSRLITSGADQLPSAAVFGI